MTPNNLAWVETKLIQIPKQVFGFTYSYSKAFIEVTAFLRRGEIEYISSHRFTDLDKIVHYQQEAIKDARKLYDTKNITTK